MQGWIAVMPAGDADTKLSTPPTAYTYEVDERSKKQIAANDLLFLRDQTRLLFVARVENVSTASQDQTVLSCPFCGIADINARKHRTMRYRCFHGHQFTAPVAKAERTIAYTAHFVQSCAQVFAHIEPAELRPFEFTNSRHIKLKLGDIAGLCAYVARRDHKLAPILKGWLRNRTVKLEDCDADLPAFDSLLNIDEQEKPFQAIRLRRGLASFRDKLIKRYGARCMISGCSVLALLEACNVSRYQRPQDNHPANGIILRSDLHTLFDLDLIGLNPADMHVTIHADLIGTEYEKFSRRRLQLDGGHTLDMRAVRARWEQFIGNGRESGNPAIADMLARRVELVGAAL